MLHIYTIPVTPFSQNARIFFETEQKSAVVVDPGGDVDLLLARLRKLEFEGLKILLTHAHIDHAGGVSECLRKIKAEFKIEASLVAHSDPILRGTIQRQAKLYGLSAEEYQNCPEPEIVLGEGDEFSIGAVKAKVSWVPGHAPDHLTLFLDVPEFVLHEGEEAELINAPVLLAGDTLFAGSIGRTDLPGGSMPVLLKNIREKLFVLPEETVVLCGHGPATTIGEEKRFNPFLQG